jgi:queuine/archaeosine tRNA-ribosyltransferase
LNESIYGNSKSAPVDRATAGPLDISEVRSADQYVDFGSIRVPVSDDLQLRLEVEEETKRIVAITIDSAESSLQIQAFAAPRHEGIWHDIRAQIAAALVQQGAEVQEGIGTLGHEIASRQPILDEAGNLVGHKIARFIGVDGPRWFLRGVISGAALTDPIAAGRIEALFRKIVVLRGETPLPPRDLLPITVPGGAVLPPGAL